MKIRDICESTSSGSVASVAQPMTGGVQRRNNVGKGVYGDEKVGNLLSGKKTRKPYANSIKEGWDDPTQKINDDYKVWHDSKGDDATFKWFWTTSKNGHIVARGEADSKEAATKAAKGKLNESKKLEEAPVITSKQECIRYFQRTGRTAEQGAAAWERGYRGGPSAKSKKKTAQKTPAQTDWMSQWEREKEDREDSLNEAHLEEEDKLIDPTKGHKRKTGLHGKDEEQRLSHFKAPFKSSGSFVSDSRGNSVCECDSEDLAKEVTKALTAYVRKDESVREGQEDNQTTRMDGVEINKKSGFYTAGVIFNLINNNPNTPVTKVFPGQGQQSDVALVDHNQAQWLVEVKKAGELRPGDRGYVREAGVIAGGIAAEGAKVDRMVKHIAKSEKDMGKSKKDAESIAWATANKRGYLDNKNKKKGK